MKVFLSLSQRSGMFFIGLPPHPKYSLSFDQEEPVEVDLSTLSEEELRHVLIGLKKGQISTETKYDLIYKYYLQELQKLEKEKEEEEAKFLLPETKIERRKGLVEIKEDNDKTFNMKCEKLMKKNARGLRTTLEKEKDIRVLKALLSLENQKSKQKQRRAVLDLLEEKIIALNDEVVRQIEKSAASTSVVDPYHPYDRIDYKVEDTEQKTVIFK